MKRLLTAEQKKNNNPLSMLLTETDQRDVYTLL